MSETTCELKAKSIGFTEELLRKFEKILLKDVEKSSYMQLIEYTIKGKDIELEFNTIDEIKNSSIKLDKINDLKIQIWGKNKRIRISWGIFYSCSITGEQNWAIKKRKEIQSFFKKYGNRNYLFNFPYYIPFIATIIVWIIMLFYINEVVYGSLADKIGEVLAALFVIGSIYVSGYLSMVVFPRFFPLIRLKIWEETKKYPMKKLFKENWRTLLRDIAIAITGGIIVLIVSKIM